MSNPEHLNERLADAARYALLRRLAPALRHNMAGSLQPLSMMAAMLEKRLQKAEPDLAALAKNSATLNSLAREAALSCMSLMGWLSPKNNDPVALDSCLEDALGLVATELSFRGFTLLNQTGGVQAALPPSIVRTVFMAALMAITDAGETPANVEVTASEAQGELLITLSLATSDGEAAPTGTLSYRELDWDDVALLAGAESVGFSHAHGRVELRYRAG
ncbi:MAG: hypothetical protein JWQ72_2119 [Polaromonas sp.]|nr:hypothetical protein [Polaromonas sp.]